MFYINPKSYQEIIQIFLQTLRKDTLSNDDVAMLIATFLKDTNIKTAVEILNKAVLQVLHDYTSTEKDHEMSVHEMIDFEETMGIPKKDRLSNKYL